MNQKLLVIGHKGVVGNATYELMYRLGYDTHGVDIGDKPVSSDIAFVCIPEKFVTADNLKHYETGLLVVRSTVPPGTCQALQIKLGLHILHNPEFAKEATMLYDTFSPDMIVIGECCKEHGEILEELYKPLQRPIVRTKPMVSELVKLTCNSYLAMLISFWNEVETIAKELGISGHEVGMLASVDSRISPYGSRLHHHYGGKCLPKDVDQLITIAHIIGLNPKLLEAIKAVNNSLESET